MAHRPGGTCHHRVVRVERSFAFIDLSGFTALTEREGDERAVTVLDAFRSLVRTICSRRGVRVAKWLGDGAMLVNVQTAPVLEATLEMQFAAGRAGEPMALRGAVSCGEVILYEGDDYIGHCVNVAARLSDLAGGGEVLATAEAVGALPPWATVEQSEEVAIRGIERPLPVARLGFRPLEGEAVPDPVCGIPLTRAVAPEIQRDRLGREVWFCSDSCRDTWERRPGPEADERGSLRSPLIGS